MCSNLSGNILHVALAGLHLCSFSIFVLGAEASGVCVCTSMSMNYLFVSVCVCVCAYAHECICSGSHGNNTFLIANIRYDLLLYC